LKVNQKILDVELSVHGARCALNNPTGLNEREASLALERNKLADEKMHVEKMIMFYEKMALEERKLLLDEKKFLIEEDKLFRVKMRAPTISIS